MSRVADLSKSTDLEPEDHFFNRLVQAGYGDFHTVRYKMTLADCVRAHQQLDLKAETERIAHRMNSPRGR